MLGGGGKWKTAPKRVVRPTVETARDLIVEGLDEHGFRPGCRKKMVVWRATERYLREERGVAHGAQVFDVNLNLHDIKRRRVARKLPEIVEVGFHEVVHTVRSEHFEDDGLLEMAVTEGMAYGAGSIFCRSLMQPNEFDDIDAFIAGTPTDLLDRLTDAFVNDVYDDVLEPNDAYHELWFETPIEGFGLPPGIAIGVSAVSRFCQANNTRIAEIVGVPATNFFAG